MGRQRNNPQSKVKEESLGRVLNEIEGSKLSDIEFEITVTRKVNENYKELQRSNKELTGNYISIKKNTETITKSHEKMKDTISELKNTAEVIKSRLDEAEDRISKLEDKVEKNTQKEPEKEKKLRKNKEGLREVQDNMKRNNIHIIGVSEGGEEEQRIENLFEKVMMENFPNLMTEKVTQIQ